MRVLLTVFAALGGLLPITSLVWGWLSIRKDYHALVRDLDAIDEVINAPLGTHENPAESMYAIRRPAANAGRVVYTFEWIQRMILHQAMADLRWPAWIAGAGVIFGTVASIWSLWL
ncbi:hypothetical protein [Streptomyces sp. NPDC049881]|uniref:hypothetical protein n=1 Tax=Streptomyces sp. NPDC049881 TaxID=3155778 RepID=UPI003448F9A7